MSKNVVTPKRVSFEDALRNLASRLTGRSAAELPRSQEGVVQFMAENVPSFDEMAEAVTQEVLARLETAAAVPAKAEPDQPPPAEGEPEKPNEGQQKAHNAPDAPGGTSTPDEGEKPNTEAPVAADKPKRGKSKTAK